jgi:hypothetical protein
MDRTLEQIQTTCLNQLRRTCLDVEVGVSLPLTISLDVCNDATLLARLDADGNEISTEAEDEIERVRAQVRVRALSQIRASATRPRSTLESGVARRETLTPMTRTSITHVWDDNEGVTARVRLNAPLQTVISPSADDINGILSETHTSAHLVPQTGSINRPRRSCDTFVADPLPMPLADMVTCLPTLHKPYPRTVIVHKYANLAGR